MQIILRYFVLVLLASCAGAGATPRVRAQASSHSVERSKPLPIVFVHGNGDDAAKWIGVLWLFESNGYPADRLFAIRFTMPVARADDTRDEPARSSTADSVAELSAFVSRVLLQTRSQKVILIGSSRGGLTIRNYIVNGGGRNNVEAAILAGTPNHGVMAVDTNLNNEFNGKGTFLQGLNHANDDGSEVVSGNRFLTLRSDALDKYAQPPRTVPGSTRLSAGVGFDGPALKGAKNEVLAKLDHRELAFAPTGFRSMYRFITGSEPRTLTVTPEQRPTLSGLITGFAAGAPTNQPLSGVKLKIFPLDRTSHGFGQTPVYETTTGANGGWGPVQLSPTQEYEFDLEADGRHVRYFKAPLPRSSNLLNLRMVPSPAQAVNTSALLVSRPQGYFSRERDPVMLDGALVSEEPDGLPIQDSFLVSVPSGKLVEVTLRTESVAAQPSSDLAKDLPIVDFLW